MPQSSFGGVGITRCVKNRLRDSYGISLYTRSVSSVDPIYIVPSSAANPSKFFEIPFRGTVAEPSTRPARAPKAPPRRTGRRRPALPGAAQKRSPRAKAAP